MRNNVHLMDAPRPGPSIPKTRSHTFKKLHDTETSGTIPHLLMRLAKLV